ncbi:MAG TPA: hypothetical protein DDW52_07120 [Planctomycetaceae bacterium]|nr:hypothetical protein [Planctomycetaceae bacterium]
MSARSWVLCSIIVGLLCAASGSVYGQTDESSEIPSLSANPPNSRTALPPRVIVVTGAGGTEEYAKQHDEWADSWYQLAEKNAWPLVKLTRSLGDKQKARLEETLAESSEHPTWLVLIGHGTAAGSDAKFNLVGEDVSSSELSRWLRDERESKVVVACFSASGAFLPALSRSGCIVVSATQSGSERNYSRFGKFVAQSLGDEAADLDHDREVSLLEAFLFAANKTGQFYADSSRLASEHAIIDDNQDGKGTGSEFFIGARPAGVAKGKNAIDGSTAGKLKLAALPGAIELSEAQQARRRELERRVELLRQLKRDLPLKDYYNQLETVMLDIAALYAEAEKQ